MTGLQVSSIKGDAIKIEIFWKINNEMIIFPYITIIKRSTNTENLGKSKNEFVPFNGTQLYKL